MRNILLFISAPLLLNSALPAHAAPYTLALSRPQSSVRFGLSAPTSTLRLDGSLSDFTGSVIFDDERDSITHARFSMDLSSAKLPPNQVLQAILLQTILSRVQQRRTTFESSQIDRVTDSTFLVSGSYTWLNGTHHAKVPVTLVHASPSRAEISITVDGPLKAPRTSPSELKGLGEIPANASGWARAKLIFTPPKGVNSSGVTR